MFKSPNGMEWHSILVRTGMYQGGKPSFAPASMAEDVYAAVEMALEREQGRKPSGL